MRVEGSGYVSLPLLRARSLALFLGLSLYCYLSLTLTHKHTHTRTVTSAFVWIRVEDLRFRVWDSIQIQLSATNLSREPLWCGEECVCEREK